MPRVAVVQAGSALFDTPATLDTFARLAGEASAGGAKLAVFPEAFVGGYPKGMDFGARVGSRSDTGRDWFARYSASAIVVPGPETEQMGDVARDCDMIIVVGVIEREGGTLYCTALTFGTDGVIINLHRKLMPTAMERIIWGQGDGSTMGVVDTPLGRVGSVICWENYMPLLRHAMYAQDVEIYCAPTVDDRETWPLTMRHIAFEGRCFVLSAVQFLKRGDLPQGYPIDADAPETLICGGSIIAGPLGEILAGPVYDEETILFAEIDVASLSRAKYDFDAVGHYARPDIFQLKIDTGKRHR